MLRVPIATRDETLYSKTADREPQLPMHQIQNPTNLPIVASLDLSGSHGERIEFFVRRETPTHWYEVLSVDGTVVSGSNLAVFPGGKERTIGLSWQPMQRPEFDVPHPLSLLMAAVRAPARSVRVVYADGSTEPLTLARPEEPVGAGIAGWFVYEMTPARRGRQPVRFEALDTSGTVVGTAKPPPEHRVTAVQACPRRCRDAKVGRGVAIWRLPTTDGGTCFVYNRGNGCRPAGYEQTAPMEVGLASGANPMPLFGRVTPAVATVELRYEGRKLGAGKGRSTGSSSPTLAPRTIRAATGSSSSSPTTGTGRSFSARRSTPEARARTRARSLSTSERASCPARSGTGACGGRPFHVPRSDKRNWRGPIATRPVLSRVLTGT